MDVDAEVPRMLAALPEGQRQAVIAQWDVLIEKRAAELRAQRPNDDVLRWFESGDPERVIYEMFGLLELTADQKRIVQLYMDNNRMIAVGANGTGKSKVIAALVLGWSWHVVGYQPAADGRPQGCLLLIVAPKDLQIIDAYRSHFLDLGRAAAERGHPLAGWDTHSDLSVSWSADPARWYMRSLTAPREASTDRVSHFGLGPHHTNMVAWLEEIAGIYPAIIESLKGRLVSRGAKAVASTNPTSASGTGYVLSTRDGWPTAYSSALTHPNVLERRTIYPGAVSHETLEDDLRDRFLFEVRGEYPEAQPDTAFGDVVYSLPMLGMEDMRGPRADGIPGHPMARPAVFRPLAPEAFGRWIGTWPVVDPQQLFSDSLLEEAMRTWDLWGEPEGDSPRVVGVDGSMSDSGDRVRAVPWWGPSARMLWQVYTECRRAGIEPRSDSVQIPAIAGAPRDLANPLDEVGMAKELVAMFGRSPIYVVDPAWGGHIIAALKAAGCVVKWAHFGGAALPALEGQRRTALNARAEWFCTLADVTKAGLLALPRDSQMADDLKALGRPVEVEKSVDVVKIRPKTDIKKELGRSTDSGDALALASSEGPWASGGAVEAGSWPGWS